MSSAVKTGMQRRMRRSREEWSSLVSRFEESGQTREAFCAEAGISVSTLRRWCSRFRQGARPELSQVPVFVELPAEEKPAEEALIQPWEVELQLGGGVLLRLRRG